jgi:hypothetical protein
MTLVIRITSMGQWTTLASGLGQSAAPGEGIWRSLLNITTEQKTETLDHSQRVLKYLATGKSSKSALLFSLNYQCDLPEHDSDHLRF